MIYTVTCASGRSHIRYFDALHKIKRLTEPGVYGDRIEAINTLAREAFRETPHSASEWHNQLGKIDPPSCPGTHWVPVSARITEGKIGQALEKLSGDLSNDNVAAAKQILKNILK